MVSEETVEEQAVLEAEPEAVEPAPEPEPEPEEPAPEPVNMAVSSASGRTTVHVIIALDGDTIVNVHRDGRQIDRFQVNRELELNKEE